MRLITLLGSALLVALSVACSASTTRDDRRGELDRLTFSFGGNACFFDACSPKQAIARGAHVVVKARGDDPAAGYHARVSAGVVAEHEDLACTCRETVENGSSEGSVAPGGKCYAPAVKHCSRTITLRADVAGPALLEMLDANEAVLDRIVLVVAEPKVLVASFVSYRPSGGAMRPLRAAADGAFETDAPARIYLDVKVHGADGAELRASGTDVTLTSDDAALKPTYSDGGVAMTKAEPGVHHVTATGLGLTAQFTIRVTPELP